MMKTMYVMLIALFISSMASCQGVEKFKTIREKEFSELTKDKNAVILDVRTPEEFAEGHLENAKMIDYNGSDFETKIGTLDKSKTYMVYCRSGGRSARASELLTNKGFKVYNLDGGISSWSGKVVK